MAARRAKTKKKNRRPQTTRPPIGMSVPDNAVYLIETFDRNITATDLALLMGPLRLCGGGLGDAVIRGDPLDTGAVEFVFGSEALRRRIRRRRFGHDRRRGRRLDLCDRRLERLRLPHADLGRQTAVEGIGARHGRRIRLVVFSRLVSLFLRIRLEERILRWRALKAARKQIAGLHFGDLRLRLETIAVQRNEDRDPRRESDCRDDADEPQRAASTGAAEKAAPEPLETG